MKEDPHPFLSAYALAEATVRSVLKSKIVWLMLALSAAHIAVRVGIIVFVGIFAPEALSSILADFFITSAIVMQAGIPLVVVGAIVGANVTARDRMMGGLEFLLSKSLPPWGYVVGRVLAPFTAAVLLVALPILLFDILLLLFMDNITAAQHRDMWGGLGVAMLYCVALGPLAAGLGTMVDNPRKATGLWLGVVWLTTPLVGLAAAMEVDWYWAFSPGVTIQSAGFALMGYEFPTRTGEGFAWFLISLYIVLPLAALYWRTREVVR